MKEFINVIEKEQIFKYDVLERKLKIPLGLISRHLKGGQKLSKKNLKKLNDYFVDTILINGRILDKKDFNK